VPTQTNFGKDPEWGTLARDQQEARHMPLLQLFGRIPNVLTQLSAHCSKKGCRNQKKVIELNVRI
jgi:hypothetical protein